MTTKEQREIIEAYERGEVIELADKEDLERFKDDYEWIVLKSGIIDYEFDFYNYHYRIKKKRWRAEKGEEYFCIDGFGNILSSVEQYSYHDKEREEFGNYFQTEEQAEKAKELIKKCLTKFHEEND